MAVRSHGSWRSHSVALATAVVLLGAGGVLTSSASSGPTVASVMVPITPCRLLDTRVAPDNVGPRSTPLGAAETYSPQVWGANGNCSIPTTATAVSMNVTIIGPTSSSFLTVFPPDATRPLTANLNWVAGQAPTPNAVTSRLSADGRIGFYNLSGRVDLTADVLGYYEPATASSPPEPTVVTGPPGPQGPAGTQGPVGPQGPAGPVGASGDAVAGPQYGRHLVAALAADTAGAVGEYADMAIGIDGNPVVAYYDRTNGALKLLRCGNAACTSAPTISTLDNGNVADNDVGTYASITIGNDGTPVIAYVDETGDDLKILRCGNLACDAGNSIVVADTTGTVGWHASVAIGADTYPVVSYYDATNGDLKILKCGDPKCLGGTNTITAVDAAGMTGWYTAIAIGVDGSPVVAYHDYTNGDLEVLKCGNAACTSGNTITAVDATGVVGWYTSIKIGIDANPIIAYYDATLSDLKVAACGTASCSGSSTISTLDAAGIAGLNTSLAIGVDGNPIITYQDGSLNELDLAECIDPRCSAAPRIVVVDATGVVGTYASMAIGADANPVMAYYDWSGADLKVAKLTHSSWTPNG